MFLSRFLSMCLYIYLYIYISILLQHLYTYIYICISVLGKLSIVETNIPAVSPLRALRVLTVLKVYINIHTYTDIYLASYVCMYLYIYISIYLNTVSINMCWAKG